MIQDSHNLDRFVEAQEYSYPIALGELREGRKRSHWMWYIFPQLKHLGHSCNSQFYGISGIEEATDYLQHPVLGPRLREVSESILNLPSTDPREVFGGIDALKLRSSMTLFDRVSPDDIISRVLDKYFSSRRDPRTLKILEGTA